MKNRRTEEQKNSSQGSINVVSNTIFEGDNLPILRGINSESVDLVYLDPPFKSDRYYEAPIGSKAAGAAFKDTWTLSDVDEAEHGLLAETDPALYQVIQTARMCHGKNLMSYLIMMASRLLELKRILKHTGSIYLHCDDTASAYLKIMMDSIFGAEHFMNCLIWQRTGSKSLEGKKYARNTDHILYYTKSTTRTWNQQFAPYTADYIEQTFKYTDIHGQYGTGDLSGGKAGGETAYEAFRGVRPPAGRAWAPPIRSKFPESAARRLPTNYEALDPLAKCYALDETGLIYWSGQGKGKPYYKKYLSVMQGIPYGDIIVDIPPVKGKEATSFKTQKPLKLLERLILASSNEDDLLLDPFCGCATACIAAQKLGRYWVGIDLSPKTVELVRSRAENDLNLFTLPCTHRTDIPKRTDQGPIPHYKNQKHALFGKQEGLCAGCKVYFPFRNFTVDHILPQSKGGPDHVDNLQLLCNACNSMKGTRTQAEFLVRLKEKGLQ